MFRVKFLVYNPDRAGSRYIEDFTETVQTLPKRGDTYTFGNVGYRVAGVTPKPKRSDTPVVRLKTTSP